MEKSPLSRRTASFRRQRLALSCALVAAMVVPGCKGRGADAEDASSNDILMSEDGGPVSVEALDAGGAPGAPPQIAALELIAPIFSAPEWPPKDGQKASEERQGVIRLGYLRRGQVVTIKPNVIKKGNCSEGWYEVENGPVRAFVCGKFVTTDLSHKDLATAPHPPFADKPLPYDYGLNLTNGAPLYRRRPLKAERKDLEKGLAVGKTKKPEGDAPAPTPPPATDANGDTPWYLKDHHGQRPQVKVDDLRTNEAGGLVVFRMVRGFYLALDKDLSTASGRFWRNTMGFLAPADHVLVHKPTTEFEGVRIGTEGDKRHLPLGWVIGPHVRRYHMDDPPPPEGIKRAKRGDPVDRFTIVQLTGKKIAVEDRNYYETDEGWYLRDVDAAITRPGPAPKDLAPNEKWIDVNLTTQSLVAFEGDKPVYATIVSTGRHDDEDKSKDHRTKEGTFRIREKHIAATMEDDGASDGPYSIQDVPWIMYFEGSYALHGAFWHSSFGRERSHGCVNMTPHDAKNIFAWTGPNLPPSWHGVRATKENPGTRVIVHSDGPPLPKDPKEASAKDAKDTKDVKESKDAKEAKDSKDNKDAKAKDAKDAKDGKDAKESKESKDGKSVKDGKNAKDVKTAKDGKDG